MMSHLTSTLYGYFPRATSIRATNASRMAYPYGLVVNYAVPLADRQFGDMLQRVALRCPGDKAHIAYVRVTINGQPLVTLDSAQLQKDVYDTIPIPFFHQAATPLLSYLLTRTRLNLDVVYLAQAPTPPSLPTLFIEYRQAAPTVKKWALQQSRVGPHRVVLGDGRVALVWYQGGHLYWQSTWAPKDDDPVQQVRPSAPGFMELKWHHY